MNFDNLKTQFDILSKQCNKLYTTFYIKSFSKISFDIFSNGEMSAKSYILAICYLKTSLFPIS